MIICEKGNISVRDLEEKDNVLLLKWLTNPDVLKCYEGRDSNFDLEAIREKFYNKQYRIKRCIIEYLGKEIGYLQFYIADISEYGYEKTEKIIYSTDQFIGETDYWNKGIGTELMNMVINYLVSEMNVEKILLDPQCRNLRAIACYGKCGFEKVKVLPENEIHEGKLEDCWLMEYNK